ncbi:MAG: TlpA disulfide reductase family protein [Pseudomonadota bacterium]
MIETVVQLVFRTPLWMVVAALLVGGTERAWAQSFLIQAGPAGQQIRPIEDRPPAPEIAFQDSDGRDWGFVEFRGKLVLAIFWATWCPVCEIEMPALDRLQEELGPAGLEVIALSVDQQGEALRRYAARHDLQHLKLYRDPEAISAAVLGIRGVPTTFVIDPSGKMIGVVEGAADWQAPDVKRLLGRYLRPVE